MANKSFVLYTEYGNKFKRLTDTQLGQLLRNIFAYEETEEIPVIDDDMVGIAFDIVKEDLDKQLKNYKAKVEAGRSRHQQKSAEVSTGQQSSAEAVKDKDKDKNKDKDIYKENIKRKVFIPPTLDEVASYCAERHNNVDPQKFIDYYQTRNWELGKGRKVKDWRACVRTWERNDFSKPQYEEVKPSWMTEEWEREWNESLGN